MYATRRAYGLAYGSPTPGSAEKSVFLAKFPNVDLKAEVGPCSLALCGNMKGKNVGVISAEISQYRFHTCSVRRPDLSVNSQSLSKTFAALSSMSFYEVAASEPFQCARFFELRVDGPRSGTG